MHQRPDAIQRRRQIMKADVASGCPKDCHWAACPWSVLVIPQPGKNPATPNWLDALDSVMNRYSVQAKQIRSQVTRREGIKSSWSHE